MNASMIRQPLLKRAFRHQCGVQRLHGRDMTRMSPQDKACTLEPMHRVMSADDRLEVHSKPDRAVSGVDFKIVDGGPPGGAGTMQKSPLREQFAGHKLPTA